MRFIKIQEVMAKTSLARPTIYKYMKEEGFPKQITLGGRGVVWLESEVEDWMMEQLGQRDALES